MGGKKTVEKNREWEKGRRDKLNQSFSELSKLLPDHDPSITLSKMEILNRAAMYIKTLQRQNQDILNDGKQTFLDDEVDRLQKRVAHLVFKTKLLVDALRNAGVPIPEVKPSKSRNRKKQDKVSVANKTVNSTLSDINAVAAEGSDEVLTSQKGAIISLEDHLKETLSNANIPVDDSLKVLENSLKLVEDSDKINKHSDLANKNKDFIKISKEPLKEINSTLPSISIPKDIPSVSQAPQAPLMNAAVKEQPLLTGSIPGVLTSLNQNPNTTVPNFTFLDRSLVNLGPGTLILADGRVVNVPPPLPQIVVKPPPTLILMQKTVRREKRLYPKPKQVDITKTTFTNKAPIPTIKHINFEFKTKRSRIKVTKTRLSPKQIKRKEPVKSKVITKSLLNNDKINSEINKKKIDRSSTIGIVNNSAMNKEDNTTQINDELSNKSKLLKKSKNLLLPGNGVDNQDKVNSDEYISVENTEFISDENFETIKQSGIIVSKDHFKSNQSSKAVDNRDLVMAREKSNYDNLDLENIDNSLTEQTSEIDSEKLISSSQDVSLVCVNESLKPIPEVNILETDRGETNCSKVNSNAVSSNGNETLKSNTIIQDNCKSSKYVEKNDSYSQDKQYIEVHNRNLMETVKNKSDDLEGSIITSDINKECFVNLNQTADVNSLSEKEVKNDLGHSMSSKPDNDLRSFIDPCNDTIIDCTDPVLGNSDNNLYSDKATLLNDKETNKNLSCPLNDKMEKNSNNTTVEKTMHIQTVSVVELEKGTDNSTKITPGKGSVSYERNDYFVNQRMATTSEKSSKEFFSASHETMMVKPFDNRNSFNQNKRSFESQDNHQNNAIAVEKYSAQSNQLRDSNLFTAKEKARQENISAVSKDSFLVLSNNTTASPNQNLNNQPFINLNKETYSMQNCQSSQVDSYANNCNMAKEAFNANKSPCKDVFSNYPNSSVNKSPYRERNTITMNEDNYINPCDTIKASYSNTNNSLNPSTYSNQYNPINNSFMNQSNSMYSKEPFGNQCKPISKEYYVNHESSNKDAYSHNRTLSKDLYANQSASLNKSTFPNQNRLNKDPCSNSIGTLTKESFTERSLVINNQCNSLNKDSFVAVNKDCYTNVTKDSYNNQNSNLSSSLSKEGYNPIVNVSKNVETSRMNSVNKDNLTNQNGGQRNSMNKPTFETQKNSTADKACQPEIPLCRSMNNSDFIEVVGRNIMRNTHSKEADVASVQISSAENHVSINEHRNTGCSVNNSVMYNANQTVATFGNVSERNDNISFDRSSQKRNKGNVYNNKNSSNIVCKYTIESLFKNGDISAAAQVNISPSHDKVSNNTQSCKNHLQKRNSTSFELGNLPITADTSMNHNQNQLFQNESNQYSVSARTNSNICPNVINSNVRNEMSLNNSGCSMVQHADIHNSNNVCKNTNNSDKNNHNKMFNNTNNEITFNKNDPMLMSSDLMKSKDLDRNNFMPLLDDVRLTSDFSSDLFSSFPVAPGGQHPESMSPTAAFLLAFPLVSTSKATDNNENENAEHSSSTPTTILQIGNIDQPNPDIFHSPVDNIRPKPVDESNKDYERYATYDGNLYDSVHLDNSKRKTTQNPNFADQTNNCVEKNYRRNCDNRKRSRNQPELPSYSQAYSYPIFPNNNDFSQYANGNGSDPKSDGLTVPWTMNLNQDFSSQTLQKDVCTSTKSSKNTERKNSKNDKQQTVKSSSYSCSQQASQTAEYYVSKPERKKQKTSHSKTPVNWMAPTEPAKNAFVEPPLSQIEMYSNNKDHDTNLLGNNQSHNVYNNIVSSLEVPLDSLCFSDFSNKKSNNYSWSPSKSLLPALDNHNFVIPSTLPTLVGDLALGTSTPAETYKSFEDSRKFDLPKKADKSSSTFLDNTAVGSSSAGSNTKKRAEFTSKIQANNSFLSVSQLVDPKSQKQSKLNEIKNPKRNENNTKDKYQNCQIINRREPEQNCIYNQRNEIPNCWNDKQQKNQYKGNYSAESLIGVQPSTDTPESFHLNFNNYQAQSNYFHGDFSENTQLQQGQQYQNYFNQSASHFPTFLGDEYVHEFASPVGTQRKKKTKDNSSYHPSVHAKPQETFAPPLQKDNSVYLNNLPKDSGSYQTAGLLGQAYPNCIKTTVPYVSQHPNTTSTLTNFNLSTIFPEINDQRVTAGSSQAAHINPNFTSLPIHNYPPH